MLKKLPLTLQSTTLWDYPSQHYGSKMQGSQFYQGATPSYIIWNLLTRYTRDNDLIVDPMCGSGTTIDVCCDLKRRVSGYDIAPFRKDMIKADARNLPLDKDQADFVFVDPPYSDHLQYSQEEECIGRIKAEDPLYFEEMEKVIKEIHRILKPRRYMGLYICDSYKKKSGFVPIGFKMFEILCRYFKPIDIIAVTRHNKSLQKSQWKKAALEGNFYLRGFNYLFIMKKE
ncbi:MAG: DNA methylase [Deltaproteobacteria bacterium RIFCSPLOWO2_12_FULL_44_12]|nr:MAG: DNA methylase [Deltaproteobacteria bacterium RIFCSPHIGHO2_01_FULL_43_49]OGQ15694.1 MAG: DNA methylase [Deltaproteobacteria bacterium RIFCSPHIGHO2_02_FULL_44_53]OGQ28663.1 MAG: DNA methylase [Deltaproteobacteria bacterium RIFCSPHIGHO2_12_FULL_44_21]OGQ31985.1 MAG: DNA methylase [Deltaproteobacteria bacterium RIFCSPLOWO2_01_FULL_45_74]OGQ43599.1 MAG: DNA methylase [Deltaproteobacteria bacterium RIFCSPLOWO2_02_FULL_44_34]OGQ70187.1 MAG: DNA methylase [Deltaproteobacteria bacterium RIFCSPL